MTSSSRRHGDTRRPIAVELLLVIMGAWLYWRAARAITLEDDKARQRARLVSLLILIGGIAAPMPRALPTVLQLAQMRL